MSVGGAEFLHEAESDSVGVPAGEPSAIAARSPFELFWSRLRSDKIALAALTFIVLLILVALLAPLIVKLFGAPPPNEQNTKALDEFGTASGPSSDHLFGVDGLGRDVFSRVLYGARVSLEVALIATALLVVIGVTMGLLAGYYRGWVDTALARLMDVLLAFPILLLALGLAAACSLGDGCLPAHDTGRIVIFAGLGVLALALLWLLYGRLRLDIVGLTLVLPLIAAGLILVAGLVLRYVVGEGKALITPGLTVVIFVIAFVNWPYMARIIRGQVLSIREKEFVEASRSLGASDRRIIFREILPNLVAPIVVYGTLIIPQNILFEAALSFLGVGVQPPQASWGAMIADALDIFDTAWWYMLFPGLALLFTTLAFNLVGDGLQDALNPRTGR